MTDMFEAPYSEAVAVDPIQPVKSKRLNLTMSFTGSGLDYFLLVFKTTLLTIITLGLYYPWARCQRLNYIYRHTRVGDQNLNFHGNGKEIAIGYLQGLVIYGGTYALFLAAQSQAKTMPVLAAVGTFAFLIIVYGFLPIAVWGGRAYRSSRLSYRGIRFGMDRTKRGLFIRQTLFDIVLTAITFGLYLPLTVYNFGRRLTDATLWGNEHFHFEESRGQSVKLSLTNFLLAVFSFGLLIPVTFIRRFNFKMSKTRFQGMRITSNLGWVDAYALTLFPLVISTISLGLLAPWAQVWALRFLYSNISIAGELDLFRITQGQQSGDALGETASSLLDFDTGMGV